MEFSKNLLQYNSTPAGFVSIQELFFNHPPTDFARVMFENGRLKAVKYGLRHI